MVTIGQIISADDRIRFFDSIRGKGGKFPVIVSPKSLCSESGEIGDGTIIMHAAFINFDSTIGENCIINTGAIIEHDVKIGNHCHISTGAIVNGGCSIGNECFIGSGSVVKNGMEICDKVIMGAGSVVTRSITEPGIYYGNPARMK
jgi:sugar O-acyltransferase (sialic acid O-acetyltransferase NeuD family)